MKKQITNIHMGIVEDQVGWVFEYADHPQESFALHITIARQFMQGLQELVLLVEQRQRPSGFQDRLGLSDDVDVRLIGGE